MTKKSLPSCFTHSSPYESLPTENCCLILALFSSILEMRLCGYNIKHKKLCEIRSVKTTTSIYRCYNETKFENRKFFSCLKHITRIFYFKNGLFRLKNASRNFEVKYGILIGRHNGLKNGQVQNYCVDF